MVILEGGKNLAIWAHFFHQNHLYESTLGYFLGLPNETKICQPLKKKKNPRIEDQFPSFICFILNYVV